jgi:uncharacterized protein (DUF2062 family)
MNSYIKKVVDKLLSSEHSPERLAMSCCLGVFIATSPFIGLQTWILLPLCWISRLNTVVAITVLYLVNNPLTMIPIIVADYAVGYWLLEVAFGVDLLQYNPSWFAWVNAKIGRYITHYLGVQNVCFWCYILGGMIFAVLCGLLCYFPLRRYFRHRLEKL